MRAFLPGCLVVTFVSLLAAAPVRAQTCIDSAGGLRSVSVTGSSMSGILCFHTVTLHDGAGCDASRVLARSTEACSTTRRLAVSDEGVLVSVRAPRIARRGWAIVRVFSIDPALDRSLSLDDLPETASLRGSIRVTVEGGAIVFRDRRSDVRLLVADLAARLR